MKPHIRKIRGVWCCSVRIGPVTVPPLGHGYTPAEAFAEWRHLLSVQEARS